MGSETNEKTVRVRDAMTKQVVTISPNDSAQSAARLMNAMNIGILPVEVPGTGRVVGIVTDRDLVLSVFADGLSGSTALYEFMTVSAEVCHPDDDVDTVIEKMCELDLRRLVVVDSDLRVVGVITRSDVERTGAVGCEMDPLFTMDRLWDEPVIVEAPGRMLRVISTRDAMLCLRSHWSAGAGQSRQRAIAMCEQVLRGNDDPQLAKAAFIDAASEAGFQPRTWTDTCNAAGVAD